VVVTLAEHRLGRKSFSPDASLADSVRELVTEQGISVGKEQLNSQDMLVTSGALTVPIDDTTPVGVNGPVDVLVDLSPALLQQLQKQQAQILELDQSDQQRRLSNQQMLQKMDDFSRVTQQLQRGMQDLLIKTQAQGTQLQEQEAELRWLKAATLGSVRARIKIAAGQICVVAVDENYVKPTTRTTKLSGRVGFQVMMGVMKLDQQETQDEINSLIDRRNNEAAHVTSIAELDALVEECLNLCTPELRQQHHWEYIIIDNYDKIKASLPQLFC
jgi:hypothetical protein